MIPCVYCLRSGRLRREQILLRGRHLYLCAPRGQLVEGYLVVAPYECTGCLADLPAAFIPELVRLKKMVEEFYATAYGVWSATFYEQGRDGRFDAAVRTLHEAIAEQPDCDELAELYGMLGGTLREQGNLVDAIAAYDTGSGYEPPDNTYNELNRLVTRILLQPGSLAGSEPPRVPGNVAPLDVTASLIELLAR